MEKLNTRVIAAQVAVTAFVAGAFDRLKSDDRGQGAAEYIGIILVVGVVIGVVIAAKSGIGGAIVTQITNAINSVK